MSVYNEEGFKAYLAILKIKVRPATIPTTQEFKYWMNSELQVEKVISGEHMEEFYKRMIPLVQKWEREGEDVEEKIMEMKKLIRDIQKDWKKAWGRKRGHIMHRLGYVNAIHVRSMAKENRVPFERILNLAFDEQPIYGKYRKVSNTIDKCDEFLIRR